METKLVLTVSSICLMIIVFALAWFDGMLFPSQMLKQYSVGFPAIANGSIWGNMVIMTVIIYIVGNYINQWNGTDMAMALIAGLAVMWVLFEIVYPRGRFPDALVGGGKPISPAGIVMMLYGTVVLAFLLLFYFRTSPMPFDAVVVGALLLAYIIAANHLPLALLNNTYYFVWCPDVFTEESSSRNFIVGEMLLVGILTWWKTKAPLWGIF